MFGLPDETLSMAFETIELNRKIKPTYTLNNIFQPYPGTHRITIAADRDEDKPVSDAGYKCGERAARAFALRHHQTIDVAISFPGGSTAISSCGERSVYLRNSSTFSLVGGITGSPSVHWRL